MKNHNSPKKAIKGRNDWKLLMIYLLPTNPYNYGHQYD